MAKQSNKNGPWGSDGGPWGSSGNKAAGGKPSGDEPVTNGPEKPNAPEIERILRRGRQQLNRFKGPFNKPNKPGNNGSKKLPPNFQAFFDGSQPKNWIFTAGIIFLIWLASGFYIIDAKEEGVILRLGKFHRTSLPGLNYHFPYPIESLTKIPVTVVNVVEVGIRSANGRAGMRNIDEESLMLTGDENIVDINFEVQWKVSNARNFVFNVREPENTVRSVSESAMREVIGRTPIVSALAEGRQDVQENTQKLIQDVLNHYNAGIEIVALQLRRVDPPQAVIDAFRDVQTARADRERAQNEAKTYNNDIIPRARGEAQRIVLDAEAYRSQKIAAAEGQAQRFASIYEQYRNARDVTKKRLYLETMEEVLSGMNKVVIDKQVGGNGVLPILPLNELQKKQDKPQ